MQKKFHEDWLLRRVIVQFATRLNWVVERLCALLVALMVLDIWFGILARYVFELGITWTEELARYIMIWAALLAVSCAAYYREHIGLTLVLEHLPIRQRRVLHLLLDLIGIAFFAFLFFYGIDMTVAGASQYAMIFGMTMTVPFASVPVASAVTVIQIVASVFRNGSMSAGFGQQQGASS